MNMLAHIMQQRQAASAARAALVPAAQLEEYLPMRLAQRKDFLGALRQPGIRLIAECKAASPSAGFIRQPYDPVQLADIYHQAGAACLSILTEPEFFHGSNQHLQDVRRHSPLPLLRKDFTTSLYDILEAAALGADAVLLIAAALDDHQLQDFYHYASSLQLCPLIEIHNQAELERAMRLNPPLLGINNRDLTSLTTDLATSFRLAAMLPSNITTISESGIKNHGDICSLQQAGINAFLIGESLLRQADLFAATRAILGLPSI